jgi:ribosomal protein S18 acetylase RimI-like enzyme
MQEIYNRDTFLANATWLIAYDPTGNERLTEGDKATGSGTPTGGKPVDCATIQGLAQAGSLGAIQNVGVTPAHRGRGLGRALVLKALEGFRQAEMNRVYLEVTAQNSAAIELYLSVGFRITRTVYKAVEDDFMLY